MTDLGTEFGVEVDARQICHVETFVGLVSVLPTGGDASNAKKESQPVAAGEAVRVNASGVMAKTHVKPTYFVRRVRQELSPYAKAVLEDRPLAYWPLNEPENAAAWVADHSGHNIIGHIVRGVRFGQQGPFTFDNGCSRAAEFTGDNYIETDPLPESDFANGFSVEAWTRVDGGRGMLRCPITYRDDRATPNRAGFALSVTVNGRWTCPAGAGDFWASVAGPPVVLGQWVHIVGTFTPTEKPTDGVFMGVQKLYVNGCLVAHGRQPWKPCAATSAYIGAGLTWSDPDAFFIGRIAEAAIYDRPLDANRVKAHWEAGQPSDTHVGPQQKETSVKSSK